MGVTCGITASIRFPGMLNGDLRKLGVNLVPFPRLHFFLCSFAPLTADSNAAHARLSVRELTAQAVSARNFYCNVQPDDGKVLALSFMFRGKQVESKDVDQVMQTLQQDEASKRLNSSTGFQTTLRAESANSQ